MKTFPQTTQDVPMIKKEIEEEIEKCIFRLNLETLLPFISITQETARETIIKEEIFDHCNNKLINLQENYKNNITEQQQQQINELQNTINYFYHNPKEVIKTIVDYSSQLDELKKDNIKTKIKISLITKKLELEKRSLAKSKTIFLDEYYMEYVMQETENISLLKEQLSPYKNLIEDKKQLLQQSIDSTKEYKDNISQTKEYLTKLNQQSSELNEELEKEKEQGNQDNIKLIEEKILKNSTQFKLNQELIRNSYDIIHEINKTIVDTQNILHKLESEKNAITNNITNARNKLDDMQKKLDLEKDKKRKAKKPKTFSYSSLEDYIDVIDKNLCQNQELLQSNIIKIEKIKNMNCTDIYKYKDVKKPKTLSNNSLMTMPFYSDAPSGQQLSSSMTTSLDSASTSAGGENTVSCSKDSFQELLKIGESLEIEQEQEKQELIQKELYKCIFYFKLETLVPFVSLTEESKINQKLKEEIFDHCNNKLINLQENYQDYITAEQQQHINYLQQKIEDFNKNPQLIINAIKNHITKFNELKQQQEQIQIENASLKKELQQEKKVLKPEEKKIALNKEVNTSYKIISCQEYYTYLKNQKQYNKGTLEPSIKNTNKKLDKIEQKLQLQIEKDNKLNQPETMSITLQDYIKLIINNISKNSALLRIIQLEIKKAQDKNLQTLIEDIVTQETVSKNLTILQPSSVTDTPNIFATPNTPIETNIPNIFATPNTPIETNTPNIPIETNTPNIFATPNIPIETNTPNIFATPNTPIETNTSETSSLEMLKSLFEFGIYNPNIFATPNTSTATNTPTETSSLEMLKPLFEFGIYNPNIFATPNTSTATNTPTETSDLEIGTKRKIEQQSGSAKRRAEPINVNMY